MPSEPTDIGSERAALFDIAKRDVDVASITLSYITEARREARKQGWLEMAIAALLGVILVMGIVLINVVDNFHERVDVIDVKIQKLEQSL